MAKKRYFGDHPDPATLHRLGLVIPIEFFRDAEGLYQRALEMLTEWAKIRGRALERIAQIAGHPATPRWWGQKIQEIVQEAYRLGLRMWFGEVFGVVTPIAGPSDLRHWCSLQVKATEIIREAYPACFCWRGTEELPDKFLLEQLASVLSDASPEEAASVAAASSQLERVCLLTPDDEEYFYMVDIYEEYGHQPVLRRPSPQDYQSLVRRAWNYLKTVAGLAGEVDLPPQPKGILDDYTCRCALDFVVAWCVDQESKQACRKRTFGRTRRARAGQPAPRSWTQAELDSAIYKFKAERAASYNELCEVVKAGKPGAIKSAKKLFGRNAIARALGVKAPAMVSKSPAWQEIADELGLKRRTGASTGLRSTKRVSFDKAQEQKAEEIGDTAAQTVNRRETIRLIKKHMPAGEAQKTIARLETGELSDDEARLLAQLCQDQKKDQKSCRVY